MSDEREPNLRELTAIVKAFQDLMTERDRRYDERFEAQKDAVQAALVAAKELTSQAFAAAKEAISKSEASQTSYNATHNDLTRKMDSQYKEMLPRTEADGRLKALEEKINDLRETRSLVGGRQEQRIEGKNDTKWIVALIIMAALSLAALVFKH